MFFLLYDVKMRRRDPNNLSIEQFSGAKEPNIAFFVGLVTQNIPSGAFFDWNYSFLVVRHVISPTFTLYYCQIKRFFVPSTHNHLARSSKKFIYRLIFGDHILNSYSPPPPPSPPSPESPENVSWRPPYG